MAVMRFFIFMDVTFFTALLLAYRNGNFEGRPILVINRIIRPLNNLGANRPRVYGR